MDVNFVKMSEIMWRWFEEKEERDEIIKREKNKEIKEM